MPLRLVLVVAFCTLLGLPVVAAMAASPDPSAATGPAQPTATGGPAKAPGFGWMFGNGMGLGNSQMGKGVPGGLGRGAVTITEIVGSKISLATDDGWTRTVAVTSTTKITRGGQTIDVGDLAVGDEIGFRQKKNDDGTYAVTVITVRTPKAGGEVTGVTSTTVNVTSRDGTKTAITVNGATTYLVGKDAGTKSDVTVGSRIQAEGTVSGSTFTATRIHVALSRVGGEVTAKTGSTITVKGRDGKTDTIHVDSATIYKVRGKTAAALADIAVGDALIATGTTRADGSLDASQVNAGKLRSSKHDKPTAPGASSTP
jgi:hypothetical protein